MKYHICLLFVILAILHSAKGEPTPFIIWHGINSCFEDGQLVDLKRILEDEIPGTYVYNVQIGADCAQDQWNSIIMTAINQIDHVCNHIKSDPKLANGYNGIGLSQGGLMIRGLAQRCPEVPIKGLVTYGAPSNGQFGIPDCEETTDSYDLCELARQLLAAAVYDPDLQDIVAPAQYWRDPFNHTEFINRSKFLSDLNNMKEEKNAEYKRIITSLEIFVMIMWEDDTTIIPKESSLFGFYKLDQDVETEAMEDTDFYKEDWLGLLTLERTGRLHQYTLPGGHMNMKYDWFIESVLRPFFVKNETLIN